MTTLPTTKRQPSSPRLNFNDTKNTFSGVGNWGLIKKFAIFKMIPQSEDKIDSYSEIASWVLKTKIPLSRRLIKSTSFKQFCGGESIDECDSAISNLVKKKVGTILDYSAEAESTEEAFEEAAQEVLRTIEKGKNNDYFPFAVFKMSAIARFKLLEKISQNEILTSEEEIELEKVRNRVNTICEFARSINKAIFIDAEESWIQNAIDDLTVEMMEKYNRERPLIFNTIQLYRHDRLEFLKKSHQTAKENGYFFAVKLVRGAYMDKERKEAKKRNYPSPIQPDEAATHRDYDSALRYCVENIQDIAFCAGSHNEASIKLLADLLYEKGLSPNHPNVYFAQLYGMSDNISFSLAEGGYNVAKYLPYGKIEQAIPYLTRRFKENKAVKGQMKSSSDLIMKELDRRNISSFQRVVISVISVISNILQKSKNNKIF